MGNRSSPGTRVLEVAPLLIVLGAFLVLSFSTALETALRTLDKEPGTTWSTFSFGRMLGHLAMENALWFLLAPSVLWLGRRVPLRKSSWLAPLALHGGASLCLGPLWLVVRYTLGIYLSGMPGWGQILGKLPIRTAVMALTGIPVYWSILLLGQAFQYYRKLREKELQAAGLQRSLAEAQLLALRMKLQPHFLYNTLNTISFLAVAQDTVAITKVVGSLGRLLRLSMDSDGRQLVSLEDELTLLDSYLEIEELRFKDRLRIVRNIEPCARRAQVPNLILQPLVENALKHGFSQRLDATLLEIRASREEGQLCLSVQDDGPGLPSGWDLSTRCGRGLKNVLERMEALYPGRYSFRLANLPDRGAASELRLPFAESPETPS